MRNCELSRNSQGWKDADGDEMLVWVKMLRG